MPKKVKGRISWQGRKQYVGEASFCSSLPFDCLVKKIRNFIFLRKKLWMCWREGSFSRADSGLNSFQKPLRAQVFIMAEGEVSQK